MAHVVVVESLNEDIFVCGLCKCVFNSLSLFLEHKKLCTQGADSLWTASSNTVLKTGKGLLQTSDNITTVVSSDNRKSDFVSSDKDKKSDFHITTIPYSTDKAITCSVCFRSFKRMKSLDAHVRSHNKPSQCLLCGRCFLCNSHLKRHILTHKVWPSGLNETTPKSSDVDFMSYSCPYCASVLGNYGQYRAHLNSHISLKKFKCIQEQCNGFFETVNDLLYHTSIFHDDTRYTCHICKSVYHNLEDIALHYQNHGDRDKYKKEKDNPQFKCKKCDAIFTKPEKLSLHMLIENHKKNCVHCNKMFTSVKRLRMHLQTHRQSKPYKCSICNDSFHMKKYLTSHMTKHGTSQYTCHLCKQTFKRQDILQRHKKTHMPRNHIKCPFREVAGCLKEFSRKDKLKEHLRIHSKVLKTGPEKVVSNSKHAGTLEICIVPLDTNSV